MHVICNFCTGWLSDKVKPQGLMAPKTSYNVHCKLGKLFFKKKLFKSGHCPLLLSEYRQKCVNAIHDILQVRQVYQYVASCQIRSIHWLTDWLIGVVKFCFRIWTKLQNLASESQPNFRILTIFTKQIIQTFKTNTDDTDKFDNTLHTTWTIQTIGVRMDSPKFLWTS